jgi:hypothetical protein
MGAFIQWFQCQGAHLDAASMGIIGFPPSEGGRGAVALKDIPVRVLSFLNSLDFKKSLRVGIHSSQFLEI